jgi:predicted RNase H-like HicB family nuclease
MEQGRLAFTAVYLQFNGEYIGFIEELPGMNSRGRTINEAREALQNLAAEVFDEERRAVSEAHSGSSSMVREPFFIPAAVPLKSGSDPDSQVTRR